jgi:uncharacterized protein (DUF488 family)
VFVDDGSRDGSWPVIAELARRGHEYRVAARDKDVTLRLLGAHGIAYEHRKALGTPPDIRWLFKAGRVGEGAAAFEEHLEATAARELDELDAELPAVPATALLCLEADPAACHRRIVAEALKRRSRDLEVVDL